MKYLYIEILPARYDTLIARITGVIAGLLAWYGVCV